MTDIEMLRIEIDRLQKTVSDLQTSTRKVETNAAKLLRLKKEIMVSVLPRKVIKEACHLQLSEYQKNVTLVTNSIFQMLGYEKPSFKKMWQILFEQPNSEAMLETYLQIYRNVCEFMAKQYENHWEKIEESKVPMPLKIEGQTIMYPTKKYIRKPLEGV